MAIVNGVEVKVTGKTVLQLLDGYNYELNRIVVEKNETIVPKANYETTIICDDDVIEIVSFVGGG